MAYKDFDGLSLDSNSHHATILHEDGHNNVALPDASYVRDAAMTRDGMDLVLDGHDGKLVIKDYFAADGAPNLVAPDGSTLTPDLVKSFVHSDQYAQNGTLDDVSPVGKVSEVTGHATVTHPDGTTETIANGTPIFQGDVVQTDAHGAVNITFIDETSFAVSEDARLAIDNYVYDPQTQSGETNFSVLKGVFVFTSGLIGRDDPDDVHIKTPVGSIGIRGTIIAGNVNTGEITVVEGAIVLTDTSGHEMTLATQFETARFHTGEGIEHVGVLSAQELGEKFYVVSQVSPTLFSSINDAASEQPADQQAPADDAQPDAPADSDNHSDATQVTGDTQVAQTATPSLPPVPPPVSSLEVSGFNTTSTSGLTNDTHSSTLNSSQTSALSNFLTTDTATVATTTSVVTAAPPPSTAENSVSGTTTTAPAGTSGNGSTGTINHAPTFHGEAPNSFFASAENQTWHYNFNKEFVDDSGLTNMTYQLSANTIAMLNGLMNDGGGTNPDILAAAGWTFNSTNGQLDLTFNSAFTSTPGTAYPFTIEVQAIDADGAASGYHSYNYNAYNANATTLGTTYTTDGQVISTTVGATTQISGDNNKIFLGDGNDTITLNNAGAPDTGSNNLINLGDGTNNVVINSGAINNEIVGGDNRDIVELQNGRTKVYGMDGDDDFRIVLNGTSTVITDLGTGGSGTYIDGGHSNFKAGLVLNGLGVNSVAGEAGGRGDSLVLQGAGTLNFSAISGGNEIHSIERIDMSDSGVQTVLLNYADIFRMTDDKHAMIINVGTGDTLNLSGMGGMTKVLDNVAIDDAAQGGGTNMLNYDVFTDGHVTLLVSAQAGANVTIDGTNTTI